MDIKHLLYWLWPPYEAYLSDINIANRNKNIAEDARWEQMKSKIRDLLPKNIVEYETIAKHIQDAELHRKEILDNKASTFIVAIGIAISIVSSVPALFANEKTVSIMWAIIISTAYLLAVIHFLISAYYAVKVRRVTGFAQPCVDSFLDSLKTDKGIIEERIALTLAQTKWNEDILTRKANYLSVVEDLFLHGLACVAFAAVINIAVHIINNYR